MCDMGGAAGSSPSPEKVVVKMAICGCCRKTSRVASARSSAAVRRPRAGEADVATLVNDNSCSVAKQAQNLDLPAVGPWCGRDLLPAPTWSPDYRCDG